MCVMPMRNHRTEVLASERLWQFGSYTKLGVLLTVVGIVLVLLTWNQSAAHGFVWSSPDPLVLWVSFPLVGPLVGWSTELSQVERLVVFFGVIVHWPLLGRLLDRKVAVAARDSTPRCR